MSKPPTSWTITSVQQVDSFQKHTKTFSAQTTHKLFSSNENAFNWQAPIEMRDHIDSTSHYVIIKNHRAIGGSVCEAKWIQILMDERKITFCPCEVVFWTQSIRYSFNLYRFNYADHQKVFPNVVSTLRAHLYYSEPFGNWPASLIKIEKLITVRQLSLSSLFF